MSEKDDPFGLRDRDASTIVVQRAPSGGYRSTVGDAPLRPAEVGENLAIGTGPLLAKAEALLTLAATFRVTAMPTDPAHAAAELRHALEAYGRSITRDADPDIVNDARLVVAALIDDIIINGTPWGLRALGPGQRLAGTLHGDIDAGRTFFKILDRAERTPDRSQALLELIYACLALGFEGVYRTAPPPGRSLAERRTDLYHLLQRRQAPQQALSPHWRGLAAPMVPERRRVPLFVAPIAALAVLALLFVALSYRLGTQSNAVAALLPPAGPVAIQRVSLSPPPPLPEPRIAPLRIFLEMDAFLQEEQDLGLVEVLDLGSHYTVRLIGDELFASGSDELRPRFLPVIDKIATALVERPGPFTVVGHTDTVPIRRGRFASNHQLSEARAASVARLLIDTTGRPLDLEIEAAGATRPIADNGSAEGRARNRRVEILVPRPDGDANT